MTKKERKQIIKAINFFLDDNPDKWVDGIDELCLLVYNKKWSKKLEGKSISIYELYQKLTKQEE